MPHMFKLNLLVLLVGIVVSLWATVVVLFGYIDRNDCSMSWGRFVFVPLEFESNNSQITENYRLYLYREGEVSPHFEDPQEDAYQLGGTPVVFIPGNAGIYKQGRSMASLAASTHPEFDWFLVDFNEDFSAMHGSTLVDESRYVNDAIQYILSLYKLKGEHIKQHITTENEENASDFVLPTSVVVVGHSMGGVVARTLVTLDNYARDSVQTIFTLSTPHAYPPLTFDRDTTQLYDLVGQWWRANPDTIALVSLAGGHSDLMVLPDMSSINSVQGISAQSYEIPGVGLGIDHLAAVWCAELRAAVINAIGRVTDHQKADRSVAFPLRMSILRDSFKVNPRAQLLGDWTEEHIVNVSVGTSLLWGRQSHHTIISPVRFVLPARSSLVSYRVNANSSLHIAQQVQGAEEYRDYGVKNVDDAPKSLMWYSAGPYVPQPIVEASSSGGLPRLVLLTEPQTDLPTKVTVAVDWRMTIANIMLHYRTLVACWPFFIMVLIFMKGLAKNRDRLAFSRTMLNVATGKVFVVLSLCLILFHILLSNRSARDLIRIFQFPSERTNLASLKSVDFTVNDLFLGLSDNQLLWVGPLLLSVAVTFAGLVTLVSCLIVYIHRLLLRAFARRQNAAAATADPAAGVEGRKEGVVARKTSTRRRQFSSTHVYLHRMTLSSVVRAILLVFTLYVVPYQCTTLFLAVFQLLRLTEYDTFEFAFSQLLVFAAIVDAPVLVVWLKNLHFAWLWSFASMYNVFSALPLAIYTLKFSKHAQFHIGSHTSRLLTLAVLGYIASYTLLYASLHAFMIHHFMNYLAFWLIIIQLEAPR